MHVTLRIAALTLCLIASAPEFAGAQYQPPPPLAPPPQRSDTFTPAEDTRITAMTTMSTSVSPGAVTNDGRWPEEAG